METIISPSVFDELQELEREMESQGRTSKAKALRETIALLVKPSRGWITTGQAAERLGITIPTVKSWISRDVLVGRQVGNRWWVSSKSVDDVLNYGSSVAELEEDTFSTDEEAHKTTRKVRHQMGAEKRASSAQK